MRTLNNFIDIKNITRSFSTESQRGVFDVSFNIKKGEVVCVLGPSGCGKSTLLRLLAGLEKPNSGLIKNDSKIDQKGGIIYVPQEYTLWPHLSVLQNLILAPQVVKKMEEGEAIREAEILLKRFGLLSYRDAKPKELSGGQKQRIALLRAIMMKPNVLLLDEVTSALDPELTKSVLDMIRTLAKDGYTMIVVTHHISLALAIADTILFLDEGKLIQHLPSSKFFREQDDERILSFIKGIARWDRNIEIFEGIEQFQAYHLGLLKRLPEGTTIHVAGAVGDRWYEPMGELYETYERLRISKKIKWKMAMYEFGDKDEHLLKSYPEFDEFRQMPRTLQNPANYNVMGDTVIIQVFGTKPTVLEIRDASVAEAYLKFFEELWNVSTPIN